MGIRIATEIHGQGDALVMVHGLGGTSNVFTPLANTLSRYFKVIRLDLPGSGRTKESGAITMPALVDDVISVMDEHGADTAHLVGHSLGTILCQHLAVQAPQRVNSLALIGPLLAPPEAGRGALRDRAAKARSEGMAAIADSIVQGGTSAETKAHRPEVAALVREILMRQDPEGYARTCEALAAAEAADIERIQCPALLITGDEDTTAPPPAVRSMSKRIPGALCHILSRCGHWAPFESPKDINGALMDFYFSA